MIGTPIGAAFAACVISLLLTGLSILVSRRLRLFDQPDARKVHQQATPRLGGVGIIGAAMILIMVWRPGGILSHREPTLRHQPAGEQA